MSEQTVTREEFENGYAGRSNIALPKLLATGRVAIECDRCDGQCEGWQMGYLSTLADEILMHRFAPEQVDNALAHRDEVLAGEVARLTAELAAAKKERDDAAIIIDKYAGIIFSYLSKPELKGGYELAEKTLKPYLGAMYKAESKPPN